MDAAITVILPVRNGAAFIAKAIESVLAQSYRGVRLVVSDNGSTDATAAIVAGYLADPRVRLVTRTENYDMLAHFNKCLDAVDTEYYMLLCHDDYLCDPAALEKAHRALQGHAEISAAYCDIEYVDSAGRLIFTRRFGRSGAIRGDVLGRSAVIATRNLFGIPLLVRTRTLEGARYDKDLPYAADLDLAIAMARRGCVLHIPEALIANRYHRGNETFRVFRTALREMKRIAAKQGIALSGWERLHMLFNAWKTVVQKWVFFQYVQRIRKAP
jgi:glycosyltransferase involved in cell wall biosynthesis